MKDKHRFSPFRLLEKTIAPYRGLPRSVYTLFVATVVNGAGIFVFPFMALILTRRFGLSEKETGDIVFLTTVAYVPGTLLGGRLADRFGRKRVQMVSQFLCGALFIPCGFLNDPYLIAGFIIASVFFDGVTDPARTAMSMDVTTPENRQGAFSLIYLGHNLGFAVGQIIAGFLFASAPSWMFWGNAMAVGASLLLVGLFLPESRPSDDEQKASLETDSSEKAHEGNLWSALRSRPSLLVFAVLTTFYGFSYAQHRFTMPLQATSLFGDSGARLYGLMMTLNAVCVVALTTPLVALTKRFRPIFNVAAAGVLYAVGFGVLAFARSPWLFFASTALWTVGEIVQATNESVYVSNHTPMSHRGRFNAVLPLISGLGFSLSTPIAGRIADRSGLPAVWVVVAASAGLAAAGVWALGRYEKRKEPARQAVGDDESSAEA
ncbi:MAG TPA: MFS transporter [Spirochaetia bacterium]|nr:MFS transporter [Spirochaetales bacterium]HRW24629.1 MFS transporter [Spirochaetia bacterium]